jgi:hypothetical protein
MRNLLQKEKKKKGGGIESKLQASPYSLDILVNQSLQCKKLFNNPLTNIDHSQFISFLSHKQILRFM